MILYKKSNDAFKIFEVHLILPTIQFSKTLPQDIYGEDYKSTKLSFPSEIVFATDKRTFFYSQFVILGFGLMARYQWDY